MSRHLVTLLVVLALLSLAPMAEAAPDARIHEDAGRCSEALASTPSDNGTCVVFYGHIEEFLGGGWSNAQRPPDTIAHRELGVWQASIPPYWDLHQFGFILQSGPIEYDADATVNVLPGRFTDPFPLVEDVPIFANVHFTIDQTAPPPVAEDAPAPEAGLLPCVTVEAALVLDHEVVTGGSVVGPLVRPDVVAPELECHDEGRYTVMDGITSFDIEIPSPDREIAKNTLVAWVVHAYVDDPSGARLTPSGVKLVQGPDHLNHVVVPFDDGLEVTAVRPQWHDARLYVKTNVSNPWGDYDIDHETLDLQVIAPDGSMVAARSLGDIEGPEVKYSVFHDTVMRPLTAYFEWDLLSEGLEDGRYMLKVSADNAQHLTNASAEAAFVLDDGRLWLYDQDDVLLDVQRLGPAEEAPSVGGLGIVFALTALVACFGRSRRAH